MSGPPLAGRTAIVTGACGGIGSAVTRCVAEAGARLCLTDLDGDGSTGINDLLILLGNWG